VENVTAGGNIQEWGEIPLLGTTDFYCESIQPHDKSIKNLVTSTQEWFYEYKDKSIPERHFKIVLI
jgi:hypothetical protein